MTIHDILTEDEIDKIRRHIENKVPYKTIQRERPLLDKHGRTLLFDFFNTDSLQLFPTLGHRDESYILNEEPETDHLYTWEELCIDEKRFFNMNDKKLRKTQTKLFTKNRI